MQQARAYTNLAEFLRTVKPYEALVAGRRGLELARRLGLREWEYYLVANAVAAALPTGEWDWANATLSELFEEGVPPGMDAAALGVAATFAAFRGDLESQEAALDKAREMSVGTNDPQIVAQLRESEAWIAIAEGRVWEAHQFAGAAVSADPNGSAAIVGDTLAARASLWLRDAEGARRASTSLRSRLWHGAWLSASRIGLEAGLAVLEGRLEEAAAGYRRAEERFRGLRCSFDLALAQLDFVMLAPDHPEARADAEEAKEIFERLGAKPFLERLGAALSSNPTG